MSDAVNQLTQMLNADGVRYQQLPEALLNKSDFG